MYYLSTGLVLLRTNIFSGACEHLFFQTFSFAVEGLTGLGAGCSSEFGG